MILDTLIKFYGNSPLSLHSLFNCLISYTVFMYYRVWEVGFNFMAIHTIWSAITICCDSITYLCYPHCCLSQAPAKTDPPPRTCKCIHSTFLYYLSVRFITFKQIATQIVNPTYQGGATDQTTNSSSLSHVPMQSRNNSPSQFIN